MNSGFLSENLTGLILLVLRLGLTAALYAFLIYAVRTIWQDLKQQTHKAAHSHIPPISLTPEGAVYPSTYRLNQITIGRAPTCDLCLQDETVSAVHALLYFRQNQWWVEDNHSSNGTMLNEGMVEIPTVLTSGDQLSLGSITIQVDFPE